MSLPDSAKLTPAINLLTIDVRGRRCERLLGMFALLAVAVVAAWLEWQPLHGAMFFLAASAVVGSGLWWQGWLGGQRRLTNVSWLADGQWLLADARHSRMAAQLLEASRVGSRWLWLRWQVTGSSRPRRRSLLLVQGDVAVFDLRRLSVRLRLEPTSRQPARADTPVRDDDF